MKLSEEDAEQFYRLWFSLLSFANERRKLVEGWPDSPQLGNIDPNSAIKIRDAIWADTSLLSLYCESNPSGFSEEDLEIVAAWKHRVAGSFFAIKQTRKYALFLDTSERTLYGVTGLISSLEEMIPYFPFLLDAVLIPFKGKIVIDGLFRSSNIMIGSNMRRSMALQVKDIEDSQGVHLMLPPDPLFLRQAVEKGNAKLIDGFRRHLIGSGASDKVVARNLETLGALGVWLGSGEPPVSLLRLNLDRARAYLEAVPDAGPCLKRYARYLEDSGRGDSGTVWELQELRRRG